MSIPLLTRLVLDMDVQHGHRHVSATAKPVLDMFGLSPCLEDKPAWGIEDPCHNNFAIGRQRQH